MQRGQSGNSSGVTSGLGSLQTGERIIVNRRPLSVIKKLGEGKKSKLLFISLRTYFFVPHAFTMIHQCWNPILEQSTGAFSFVYLVQDEVDKKEKSSGSTHDSMYSSVLKITSISSREQKEIAEKEAALLRRLKHPNIVRMFDYCYRTVPQIINSSLLSSVVGGGNQNYERNPRTQHMILMEYCADGHAFDVIQKMETKRQRLSLNSLIVAFGQICNAVSYLHAQKPAICHRDLKPNNFLVNDGTYKLCDFGSVVFGDVELTTQLQRAEAEEVIQKTTTQMFRAPEMVDLYMSDKLTRSTDVWALGCCLYSMAFFRNCFEEGSNLAIISNNYKIPDKNPYGDDLVELIDRMLTEDYKDRADMTEVIMCLSALYAGKELPKRNKKKQKKTKYKKVSVDDNRIGSYRTNGQGINNRFGSFNSKSNEVSLVYANIHSLRNKSLILFSSSRRKS